MMEKHVKIYVSGHMGMVGAAIVIELQRQEYDNLIFRTHKELDLTHQDDVEPSMLVRARNAPSKPLPNWLPR